MSGFLRRIRRARALLHAGAIAAGLLCGLGTAPLRAAQLALDPCLTGAPVALVVRIGDGGPRQAWLRGGDAPPLAISSADGSQLLWSAAAQAPSSQVFHAMHAAFAGSLLPLDLDGDGIHDRLYAGDLAGRIWRFDLHHGLPAEQWATGGVFADLSSGALRGFVVPPDVSLGLADTTAGNSTPAPVFNIALGTARLGPAAVDNRFYVLRDRAPFESWSQAQYARWRPLRESDLSRIPRLGAGLAQPSPDGFYIETGGADVLSPTLTASGRAVLALAEPGALAGPRCSVAAVVSAIDLATGSATRIASTGTVADPRPLTITVGERFQLQREGHIAACSIGDSRIPGCDVDLTARARWWRREDAD